MSVSASDLDTVLQAVSNVCFDGKLSYFHAYFMDEEKDLPEKTLKEAAGCFFDGFERIYLNRGCFEQVDEELVQVVFHELVHAYCWKNNAQDDCIDGYHTEVFKRGCEEHGAECFFGLHGFSYSLLKPEVLRSICREIDRLEREKEEMAERIARKRGELWLYCLEHADDEDDEILTLGKFGCMGGNRREKKTW